LQSNDVVCDAKTPPVHRSSRAGRGGGGKPAAGEPRVLKKLFRHKKKDLLAQVMMGEAGCSTGGECPSEERARTLPSSSRERHDLTASDQRSAHLRQGLAAGRSSTFNPLHDQGPDAWAESPSPLPPAGLSRGGGTRPTPPSPSREPHSDGAPPGIPDGYAPPPAYNTPGHLSQFSPVADRGGPLDVDPPPPPYAGAASAGIGTAIVTSAAAPTAAPDRASPGATSWKTESGKRKMGLFRARANSVIVNTDSPLYFVQQPGGKTASVHTREKATALKYFVEQRYTQLHRARVERVRRRQDLNEEMDRQKLDDGTRARLHTVLIKKESEHLRLQRQRMHLDMFQRLGTIGRGAFGEVCLVRKKETNKTYAMKTLRKADVLRRGQVTHVKAERDLLAEADNAWVVRLFYSFQDKDSLYLVMDFVPGGDLMSLLVRSRTFGEGVARFFIAEMVMAIDSVHKMGFIHRDIKPDNILIGADGHIKLSDFGLCTGFRWNRDDALFDNEEGMGGASGGGTARDRSGRIRSLANSLVGTPNYIAPEVFQQQPYDNSCDWWSVGVILYEMLVGRPPFLATTARKTRQKVINWRRSFRIPKEANLSPGATSLIRSLICDSRDRLGHQSGIQEFQSLAFFDAITWDRTNPPPYVPKLSSDADTSHFNPVLMAGQQHPGGDIGGEATDGPEVPDSVYTSRAVYGESSRYIFGEFNFRRFWNGTSPA